jgi:L-aminopeptidase/D-esterase-like protein
VLRFDWPAIEIGVASYEEGPTGVTVFYFPHRVSVAVDVRGGAPGTVNTDAFRTYIEDPFVDAVVFAGGSLYGEEAIASVAPALMERGTRGTNWGNVAVTAGAILYDFRDHRLNDIYPDKALGRAAVGALQPGVFPMGAAGAGRMATQGDFFGCTAHSGQGGVFRTSGKLKIAAFVAVNAGGTIVDRTGHVVRCHRNPLWGDETRVDQLLARVGTGSLLTSPGPSGPGAAGPAASSPGASTPGASNPGADAPSPSGPTHNTTLSLIVINRQMSAGELQRLAIQVHTSMARAIQPFSSEDDGDTLYAASTQELPAAEQPLTDIQIDAMAGEAMWDAILASVPEEPAFTPTAAFSVSAAQLARLTGYYNFGPHARVQVSVVEGKLMLTSSAPNYFDIPQSKPVPLIPQSPTEFYIDGRYRTRIAFAVGPDGHANAATINPGPWAQHGDRRADRP